MVIKLKEIEYLANATPTKKLFNFLKKEFPKQKNKDSNIFYQFTGLSTILSHNLNNLAFINVDYLYVETISARTVFEVLGKVKGIFAIWNPKNNSMFDIIGEVRNKTRINWFVIVRPKGIKHLKTKVAEPKKAYSDLLKEEKKGCTFLFPSDHENIKEFLEDFD